MMQTSVLAREAELRALKAQVNPHFLFNSLNSISALTSSDPAKAREMCILLGDFLRRTLGLGEKSAIPLEEEMSLIHAFWPSRKSAIGARLHMEEKRSPKTRSTASAAAAACSRSSKTPWLTASRISSTADGFASGRRLRERPSRSWSKTISIPRRRHAAEAASVWPTSASGSRRATATARTFDAKARRRSFSRRHHAARRKREGGCRPVSATRKAKIRAVIVDDEELARQILREFLQRIRKSRSSPNAPTASKR